MIIAGINVVRAHILTQSHSHTHTHIDIYIHIRTVSLTHTHTHTRSYRNTFIGDRLTEVHLLEFVGSQLLALTVFMVLLPKLNFPRRQSHT